jgi:hypothetical protein
MDKGTAPSRICVICQRDIPDEVNFCPHCGHNYSRASGLEMGKQTGTVFPLIGGLLIMVVGLFQVANGLICFLSQGIFVDYGETAMARRDVVYGIVLVLSGLIAGYAGSLAMKRTNLTFSLAGGLIALGAAGFQLSVGSTIYLSGYSSASVLYTSQLALVGIILIALARDEFDEPAF